MDEIKMTKVKNLDRQYILPAFFFFLYAFAAFQVSFPIADPDLWGHLHNGNVTWATKAIHQADVFSFTQAGKVWVNHEWLGDLVLLFCFTQIGQPALIWLKMLIGLGISFLILRMAVRHLKNPLLLALIFLLVIRNVALSFMVRPQIIMLLFFTFFVFAMHSFRNGNRKILLTLPPLMFVWTCIHGGFVMGLVLMWVETFLLFFPDFRKKPQVSSEFKWLFGTSIASSLIVFANPYGFHLLHSVVRAILNPLTKQYIGEWRHMEFSMDFIFFFALLLIAIPSFILSRKPKRDDILRCGVFLAAAILSVRNIPIFCIAAVAPIALHFGNVLEKFNLNKYKEEITSKKSVLIGAGSFSLVGLFLFYLGFSMFLAPSKKIQIPTMYPVETIQFIKQNNLSGKLWIPFNWGEHAIWQLFPNCVLNVDGGRYDLLYSNEQLEDSFLVSDGVEGWINIIKSYDPDIIVMERKMFVKEVFNRDPEWELVFQGPVSLVYLPVGIKETLSPLKPPKDKVGNSRDGWVNFENNRKDRPRFYWSDFDFPG